MIVADDVVERAGRILHRHIGLRLERSLQNRLSRAIGDGAELAGLDAHAYLELVAADPRARQQLFDRVTVQETAFFRHPEHFEVLAEHILPTLRPPVQLWSAASSNGQEPYSLAMVLAERGVAGRVLATDISTSALRRTRQGRYAARELGGLDPARRAQHGAAVGTDGWQVSEALRERVDVEACNLMGPLPARLAGCHVVFCRNVLIYFTPEHATAFVARLADALPEGAHVFLGGAESMWHMSDRFQAVRLGGTFVYRLRGPATTAPAAGRAERALPPAPRPARPTQPPRRAPTARPPRRHVERSAPAPGRAGVPPSTDELARRGTEALAAGDPGEAIRAFRRWAYVRPDDAMAHLHLGLALDDAGDRRAADRAYGRSRELLAGGLDTAASGPLEGYDPAAVVRLLDAKRSRP